jgi:hypothetical protein
MTTPNQTTTSSRRSSENPTNSPHGSELSKVVLKLCLRIFLGSPAPGPGTGPGIWDDCQASRDRNAICGYLTAVYDLVAWWTVEGREVDRARRAWACSG